MIRGPYQANRHTRFVEMVLVVDRAFFQRFDKDEWKVYDYCTSIVNHINMVSTPASSSQMLFGLLLIILALPLSGGNRCTIR